MNKATDFSLLLTPLTNRGADGKFTLPLDGWYHGLPMGEFPNVEKLPDGTTRQALQVLDAKAVAAMKNSFDTAATQPNFPGLLIDFDHFSDDLSKSSEAAGWITAWENRATGAWWQIRWSDVGDAAVRNGRFRFLSGVFPPEGWEFIGRPLKNAKTIEMKIRPLQLSGAGLTNKPNLRGMVPLSNRQVGQASSLSSPAGSKQTKGHMNSVATKLGLSAEASDDAVLAAVTSIINERDGLKSEVPTLRNRVTELETANQTLVADQIEADLDTHGIKEDGKRAKLKPVLAAMKNRADRVEFLKDCVAKPGMATDKNKGDKALLNRASTTPPGDSNEPDEAKVAKQRESEVREYALRNRCSYGDAWNAVRRDKPELFGLSQTGHQA